MEEEYSGADFRYLRTGYFDRDRHTDSLVEHLIATYPGDGVLPQRWRWTSQEAFMERYGYLGTLIWSKTASFHMMMFNGLHIFRLWTDSANSCVLDVNDTIAPHLKQSVEEIPDSCDRKCKPLTKRVRVFSVEDFNSILEIVHNIYGLDKWKAN